MEAIAWYEKELPGLGKRFIRRLDECINKLKQHPENYLIIYPPVRRILLQTFPYKLLYFVKDHQVIIIALVHGKKSNRFIKQRLKE